MQEATIQLEFCSNLLSVFNNWRNTWDINFRPKNRLRKTSEVPVEGMTSPSDVLGMLLEEKNKARLIFIVPSVRDCPAHGFESGQPSLFHTNGVWELSLQSKEFPRAIRWPWGRSNAGKGPASSVLRDGGSLRDWHAPRLVANLPWRPPRPLDCALRRNPYSANPETLSKK